MILLHGLLARTRRAQEAPQTVIETRSEFRHKFDTAAPQTTPSRLVQRPSPTGAAAPFFGPRDLLRSNWSARRSGPKLQARSVVQVAVGGGFRVLPEWICRAIPHFYFHDRGGKGVRLDRGGGGGEWGGCAAKVCADGASPSSRVFERRCRAVGPEWGAVPGTKALPRQ
jgi:hypothetical protein